MADLSNSRVPDDIGTPADLIEDLGAELAAVYGAAEEEMIAEVRREVVAQLAAAGAAGIIAIPEILARLRRRGAAIAAQVREAVNVPEVIDVAAKDGKRVAVRLVSNDGVSFGATTPPGSLAAVEEISRDLEASLIPVERRIVRWMPDVYRAVVSSVSEGVVSGARTIQQAQERAVEDLLARGVTGFVDVSGRQWRIGSYVEMATRTAVNRAWQASTIASLLERGFNLVTIVIGLDACKVCARHAGRVWSVDGTPAGRYVVQHATEDRTLEITVAGTLDQARASGWNHPNCRCVISPFFAGFPIEGTTHDPEREAARDRLRALERRVRDLKRREAAAFDDVSRARYRSRVRAAQRDIREHTAATGVKRKPYREQLAFADGRVR